MSDKNHNVELLRKVIANSDDKEIEDLVEHTASRLRAKRRRLLAVRFQKFVRTLTRSAVVGVISAICLSALTWAVPPLLGLTPHESIMLAPVTGIAHFISDKLCHWLFV